VWPRKDCVGEVIKSVSSRVQWTDISDYFLIVDVSKKKNIREKSPAQRM
jgi:hypothetical protein